MTIYYYACIAYGICFDNKRDLTEMMGVETSQDQFSITPASCFSPHGYMVYLPPSMTEVDPQREHERFIKPFQSEDLSDQLWKALGPSLTAHLRDKGYHPSWMVMMKLG